MPERSHIRTLLVVATAVIALDQATKAAIVATIGPGAPVSRIDLAGPWMALEYAENRGAAFGLLAGAGLLVPAASLLIVSLLLVRFFRAPASSPLEAVAVGAIVGGAAGNLIDRMRLGYVVDFIAVGIWPNFNLADSAITLGVGLLVWTWVANGTERNAVWT